MKKRLKRSFLFLIFLLQGVFVAQSVAAQELVHDKQVSEKAVVIDIISTNSKSVFATDSQTVFQTISVKVLEGEDAGKDVIVSNDYLEMQKGEVFFLLHTTNDLDGTDYYSVSEPYRLPAIYFFIGLFVVCVLIFGGIQGMRGLLSLSGSLLFIFLVLFPAILHGYSPVIVSIGVSSLIIILGSFVTHGFNKTTGSAVIGMVITILFTGFLAFIAVHAAHLRGFETEDAMYLNLNTGGKIDFVGLLLGGILIGLLGVLYDAAIGQAVAVEELRRAGPTLSRRFVFTRALRIGREHIGALVNILAIAYVGASLPLLLLFYSSTNSLSMSINSEIFATEIIRTIIGSIGLILAVPITTLVSVFVLFKYGTGKGTDVAHHHRS